MDQLTPAAPTLSLRGAAFSYGARRVLGPLDLDVHPREIVAVVGPNGSGKSTLLALLGGWLAPTEGSAKLEGRAISAWAPRARARVLGGVAAEALPPSKLSVREVVALGRHAWRGALASPSTRDEGKVAHALEALALTDLADRPLDRLSSGERARVALARCAAQDARLWLLDEPTAHLDLGHVATAVRLMRQARGAGCGLVAVLHDLNVAARLADRVVLLVEGRIHAEGAPAEVLTPEHVAAAFDARVRSLEDPAGHGPLLALDLAEDDTP